MRIAGIAVLPIILFACGEAEDGDATTLVRTEAKSYTGYVLHTNYEHDQHGRITTIKKYKDDEEPEVTVNITYDGAEVLLLSTPDEDPSFNQTKRVLLTLDESGRSKQRIEYTHKMPKSTSTYEGIIYDTLSYEYDASGFLIITEGTRYDSNWIDESHSYVIKASFYTNYTVESGNVINSDEFVNYPTIIRDGATTIRGGGHSEYHNVFSYSKSFPNRADFGNAAILNELRETFEPLLDINYTNMPDQVTWISKVWDANENVTFDHESTMEMERIHNGDGILATVRIPQGDAIYRNQLFLSLVILKDVLLFYEGEVVAI